MSATFPKVPRPHVDNVSAIADFAEIECLKQSDRNLSVIDVASAMQLAVDEDEDEGIHRSVTDAFKELEERLRNCGPDDGRYPFSLDPRGDVLRFRGLGECDIGLNYLYLLWATQLNMKSDRVHAGCNGTELFEELSKEVAVRYLGGPAPSVGAVVFGTARFGDAEDDDELDRSSFIDAINFLCEKMGEGYGYKAHRDSRLRAKDGKLDLVAWRSFADNRPGKLICFGQCKTGTSWERSLHDLQPKGFCVKWMEKSPSVSPVRLFFVADRLPSTNWTDRSVDAGIIFDRCRITEHVAGSGMPLPKSLASKIGKWVHAAAKSKGVSLR